MAQTKDIYTVPVIKATYDYELFRELEGNRSAVQSRINKIKRSINSVGYVPAPIVVNEKNEIIDGNGRFGALKELGLPIYYITVPGLTIEHCVAMNINSTNWTLRDFINSYADQGNQNYIALRFLMEKHPDIPVRVIGAAATDLVGGPDNVVIKNGLLSMEPGAVYKADEILTWCEDNFFDLKEYIIGRFDVLLMALIFVYKNCECDLDRIVQVMKMYKSDFPPTATIKYVLEHLSKMYNKNLRKNFVYFNVDYDKWCSTHVKGYQMRWGKGSKKNA